LFHLLFYQLLCFIFRNELEGCSIDRALFRIRFNARSLVLVPFFIHILEDKIIRVKAVEMTVDDDRMVGSLPGRVKGTGGAVPEVY